MPVASGEDVEGPFAVIAVRDTGVHRPFPERVGGTQPGTVEWSPAVVGHRGHDSIASHGVHFVENRLLTSQKVVTVDRGSRRHSAHSDIVVAGRDDASDVSTMMLEGLIYVPQARVVEVKAGVDVVLQVLMGVVHPVVDNGDVDAFSLYAVRPDGFDVDVPIVGTVQMPLARVQGIVDLRVVQRARACFALVDEIGVFSVLDGVDEKGYGTGFRNKGRGYPDVVRARAEVVPDLETDSCPETGACERDGVDICGDLFAIRVQ